jgi:hypothetical protein
VLVLEELRRKKVDVRTPEGSKQFQQAYFRRILSEEPIPERDLQRAAAVLHPQGWEGCLQSELRQQRVTRLLESIRAGVQIPDEEVRAEYGRQFARREVEILELDATRYVPGAGAKPGSPSHVSEQDLRAHFASRSRDFGIPRRISLEAVVFPFETLEGDRDAVLERVEAVMDDLAESVERAGATPDLAAITSRVAAAHRAPLKHLLLPLLSAEALGRHSLVGGQASRAFARRSAVGRVSDVLGGPRAWYVFRVREVVPASARTFEQARELVRQDYLSPSEDECRKAWRRANRRGAFGLKAAREHLLQERAAERAGQVCARLEERLAALTPLEQRGFLLSQGLRALPRQVLSRGPKQRGAVAEMVLGRPPDPGFWLIPGRASFVAITGVREEARPTLAQLEGLKRDLLLKRRSAVSERESLRILVRAKGITGAHLELARKIRGGKRGLVTLHLRQVFVSKAHARGAQRLRLARAALAKGVPFARVRKRFGEAAEGAEGTSEVPYLGPRMHSAVRHTGTGLVTVLEKGQHEVLLAIPTKEGLAIQHVVLESQDQARLLSERIGALKSPQEKLVRIRFEALEDSSAASKTKEGALGALEFRHPTHRVLAIALSKAADRGETKIVEVTSSAGTHLVQIVRADALASPEGQTTWLRSLFEGTTWD